MEKIKDFLSANKLSINESKTNILEIINKQKRGRSKGAPPTMNVVNEKN